MLTKSITCPDISGNTNKQAACEFPCHSGVSYPVEYLDNIAKLEPTENQKLLNLFG